MIMVFSKQTIEKTQTKFELMLSKVGEIKKGEILNSLLTVESEDVRFAVKWLYAYSPLSDIANYDFSLFLSYAEHGVFLKENSRFVKDIPEDIFLNYVLHPRMSVEQLCDCRKFFYSLLKGRIEGLSMREAVIELNYWNAEHVTYRSTDARTLSALATYNAGFGRCGEESVFAVNVFRAMGIPSRQIYTPRWAHCDDNHAWVEVWCDGKWHYLGACEPEEVLDKGWFSAASRRAMLVDSRCFGETDDIVYKAGAANIVGALSTYAVNKRLTVKVVDESAQPISGVKVAFGILNYSSIFPCAYLTTDESGTVSINCGMGSINVRIIKDDIYFERMVEPQEEQVEFVLRQEQTEYDKWQDIVSIAPGDVPTNMHFTDAQKELGKAKAEAAKLKREARDKAMFDEGRAKAIIKKYGYSEKIYNILVGSRGNFENILRFLDNKQFLPEQKEGVLTSLSEKDWLDVNIDVLTEALEYSLGYAKDENFYPYIVCPRVASETLTCSRKFISEYFSSEQKAEFRANPKKIWEYVCDNIGYERSVEFSAIVTSPIGALTVKSGHPMTRKVLFVTICRTLGIAARLNPINHIAQYYDGEFLSVENLQVEKDDCVLILESDEKMQYWTDFAIGELVGGEYVDLELSESEWNDGKMTVKIKSGEYRIITDNRLPNGNLFASKYHFRIASGETKTIKLVKQHADLSEMLFSVDINDFKVKDVCGKEVAVSKLIKRQAVFMMLDEGTEPTEHILNEMLELESEFKSLDTDIIFAVRGERSLSNAKLSAVLKTFDKIKVCYCDFEQNSEPLARRLFHEPGKFPLIVVTDGPLNAVYSSCGYNVGSGDMIIKVCKFIADKKN